MKSDCIMITNAEGTATIGVPPNVLGKPRFKIPFWARYVVYRDGRIMAFRHHPSEGEIVNSMKCCMWQRGWIKGISSPDTQRMELIGKI